MNVIIVDGNNLCYRALVIRGTREATGIAESADHDKEITLSIIQGFLGQLRRMSQRYSTNQFIFAWDRKPYLREKLYPDYKSDRVNVGRARHERRTDMKHIQKWGPPPRLKEPIFKLIRESVLPKIGFRNIFSKQGYEADDIIASLVTTYSDVIGRDSLIVASSDTDLYQLLDKCKVYSPKVGEKNLEVFNKDWPFSPKVWPVYRAIVGDKSDAIPGVYQVGKSYATQFITRSLPKESALYQKITSEESKKIIRRNLKLISLPWPGVGTFSLQKDELSFKALVDLANRMPLGAVLSKQMLREWRNFFYNP